MRGFNVFKIEEIAYAIIETNGNLCVIKKSEVENVTRGDLKVKVSQASLPINIIMDGKLMYENIRLSGIDDNFINDCVSKANIKTLKDVLIMTLDNNGVVFIQSKKSNSYQNLETDYNGGGKW